jgi:pSer/pThr/pTyr-binding forkhead associated (FHA) protein
MKALKIGRNTASDIVNGDVTASLQHAVISIPDSKETGIKDLNSTGGTSVNGRHISDLSDIA